MTADELIARSGGVNVLKGRTISVNTFNERSGRPKKEKPPEGPFDLKVIVDMTDGLRAALVRYSQAEEEHQREAALKNVKNFARDLYLKVCGEVLDVGLIKIKE